MAAGRRSLVPALVAGFCALALAGPAGAIAAPAGLVAGYGFEEGTGAAVTDASTSGNSGSVSGAARTPSGRFGQALSFDGVNDIVSVPDANSLDLTSGMTLEAWVKPSALGSAWRTAILKERTGNLVYGLYAGTNTGKPAGEAWIGDYQEIFGTSALPLNTWTHLTVTFDGATERLYVGGIQTASRTVTGAMTPSTGALKIGGNTVWGEWFQGLIDEVRIYNRALSTTEIQSDMNTAVGAAGAAATPAPTPTPTTTPTPTATPTPTPTPTPGPAGLVAAYGFNEGSGSSTGDLSGSGNVGSVLGGASWASAGRFGKARAFNGSNGSVKVADRASLDLTTGMTLEAWVKPAALSGWSCVILKERPEIHHLSYELSANTASDKPSAFIWVGSAERGVYGSGKLPVATWTHLASTYDGATLRIYLNGVLASSTAGSGAITASSGDLRIGGNSLWGEWFNGLIDEVRIYKQPLSAVDIQADMTRPV